MKRSLILFTALLSLAAGEPRVKLDVYPKAVMRDGAIRATCRVPRNAENRYLTFEVEGYRSSSVQLDGDTARITYDYQINSIPCDIGPVRCIVQDSKADLHVAAFTLPVAGCGNDRVVESQ